MLGTVEDVSSDRQGAPRPVCDRRLWRAPYDRLIIAIRTLRRMGVVVSTVPRLLEEVGSRIEVEHLGGDTTAPIRAERSAQLAVLSQVAIGSVIAAVLVVLLSPLFALIALAVYLLARPDLVSTEAGQR